MNKKLLGLTFIIFAILLIAILLLPHPGPTTSALMGKATPSNATSRPFIGSQRIPTSSSFSVQTSHPASRPQPASRDTASSSTTAANVRPVTVRVVWSRTNKPAIDVDVSIMWPRHPEIFVPQLDGKGRPQIGGLSEKQIKQYLEYQPKKTGPDGSVTFSYPPSSPWVFVGAYYDNDDRNIEVQRMLTAFPTAPVILTLEQGSSIFGTVIMEPDARPAAGAEVRLLDPDELEIGYNPVRITKADKQGQFRIEHLFIKKALLSGAQDNYIAGLRKKDLNLLEIAPNQDIGPITLVLRKGLEIQGLVTDSQTHAPIPKASVAVYSRDGLGNSQPATSNAQGAYRIQGLSSESLGIAIEAEGYQSAYRQTSVPEDQSPLTLNLPLLSVPYGKVVVTVNDLHGAPVENADVKLEYPQNEEAKTDAQGLAVFPKVSMLNRLMVRANKDGYASASKELNGFPPNQNTIREQMTLGPEPPPAIGFFAGHVQDPQGKPIPGIQVSYGFDFSSSRHGVKTNQDGSYLLQIDRTSNINYGLAVQGPGWAPVFRQSLTPGTKEHPALADFTLQSAHILEGIVVDEQNHPLQGIMIRAGAGSPAKGFTSWLDLPRDGQRATDAEGHFRLENLPGPTITLSFYAPQREYKTLGAKVDQSLRVVLGPPMVIRGLVTDDATHAPIRDFTVSVGSGTNGPTDTKTYSEPDGRFTMDYSFPSDEPITVSADEYDPWSTESAMAGPESSVPELAIALHKTGADIICGELHDAQTNKPLANALLLFHQRGTGPISWRQTSMFYERKLTAPDGTFMLNKPVTKNSWLFVYTPGYERVALGPDQLGAATRAPGISIALRPEATVSGLFALNQMPIARESMSLTRLENMPENEEQIESKQTDFAGQYRWDRLAPGSYRLSDYMHRLARDFELKPGEQKLINLGDDLGPLALSGNVKIDGEPPKYILHLSLKPQFPCPYSEFGTFVSGDGKYEIHGLNPGRYSATFTRMGVNNQKAQLAQKMIDISGNLQTDFAL